MQTVVIRDNGRVRLINATTGQVFGPSFLDSEAAHEFLEFLPADASTYGKHELAELFDLWERTQVALSL